MSARLRTGGSQRPVWSPNPEYSGFHLNSAAFFIFLLPSDCVALILEVLIYASKFRLLEFRGSLPTNKIKGKDLWNIIKNIYTMDLFTIIWILIVLAGIGGGFALASIQYKSQQKKNAVKIIEDAKAEADRIMKEKMLQAKEKFLQLRSEHEQAVNEKNAQIREAEQRVKAKENTANQLKEDALKKQREAEALKENYKAAQERLAKEQKVLEERREEVNRQIEQVAGMTAEEAKAQLVENMKAEARTAAQSYINDTMDEARLNAAREAKRIVINTIQRTATETAIENAVTVFNIDSDEVKGRIIGREGRNIRALEAATGVEIVVDDTPDTILLSAFDPVRREVARLALHQLVTDGRIHPARIEEVVAKVSKQLEEEILETGKRTCIDLGIHGLNIELIRLVGRMKYRSSYGQNLLQHAREVANICATMASELGLNPKIAKRAGLLHDIGKVSEEEPELPHAILGAKLAEQYHEKPEICNAIGAHHEEMEMTSIISPLVLVADAISGARPGARREVIESYIQRLKALENIAASYEGVTKSYAIQAGRELRVIVGAEQVSDERARSLSGDIARQIQDEMTYPGQVKVTVIREIRSVAIAK